MKLDQLLTTEDQFPVTYSMEDLFNFLELKNYFTNFISKIVNVFSNKDLTPQPVSLFETSIAVKLIKRYPLYNLEHFTVITPEYITGDIVSYYNVLNSVLAELTTVKQRVLDPLEKWAGYILSDNEYVNKIWPSVPLGEKVINQHTNQIHQYFNTSVGDGVNNQLFIKTYKTSENLKEGGAVLDNLVNVSVKMLDNKIIKQTEHIAELITKITQKKPTNDSLNRLPFEKLKPIGDLTLLAAKELELLAIVIYQVKIASYAYTQTINKINKEMN